MTPPTRQQPLADYELRLLGELRTLVEDRAAAVRAVCSGGDARTDRRRRLGAARPRGRSRWRALPVTAAVLAAVSALVLLIQSSGSRPTLAQAFPILSDPSTPIPRQALASILRDGRATVSAAQARLDARDARAFMTPLGTGYVITDARQSLLCLAAPGLPVTAGSPSHAWDATCGPAAGVTRTGTVGLLSYSAIAPRRVFLVDILPKNASAHIRRPGGRVSTLALSDGVLAKVIPTPSTVSITIAGRTQVIHAPTASLGR